LEEVGFSSLDSASTAWLLWNMKLRPTWSEPFASPRGCLSDADASSSLALFAAPQETTTRSPWNVSS
jgi:hypothetical protein